MAMAQILTSAGWELLSFLSFFKEQKVRDFLVKLWAIHESSKDLDRFVLWKRPGGFENPFFVAARLIKKLRKLMKLMKTWDFLKFFFDVFRGQNNLKPHSNDQCKAFHLLSYCRNSVGLNRSLISRSSIWRLIPSTNLLPKQPTMKNITRTIWITTKWKPPFDYSFSFAWFRLEKIAMSYPPPSIKSTNHTNQSSYRIHTIPHIHPQNQGLRWMSPDYITKQGWTPVNKHINKNSWFWRHSLQTLKLQKTKTWFASGSASLLHCGTTIPLQHGCCCPAIGVETCLGFLTGWATFRDKPAVKTSALKRCDDSWWLDIGGLFGIDSGDIFGMFSR